MAERSRQLKKVHVGLLSVAALAALTAACTPSSSGPSPAAPAAPAAGGGGSHGNHDCPGMSAPPIGGIAPQTPMLCTPLGSAPTTFTQGGNSWLDEFDHGASMASLGGGYVAFENIGEVARSSTFRHNDHWMVDVESQAGALRRGGSFMRPDRTFTFVNGKLVVEVDVAAGVLDYLMERRGEAWPEIVVSTAARPSQPRDGVPDEGYAYGYFKNAHTVGVRLHAYQIPIAAYFEPDNQRVWEITHFRPEGGDVRGGYPEFAPGAWRQCDRADPDVNCRDKFRFEITKSSITLYVNGRLYMQDTNLPAGMQISDAMINSPVYVYFASWITDEKANRYPTRFHWDRIAVNP